MANSNASGLSGARTVWVSHALHLAGMQELNRARSQMSSAVLRDLPSVDFMHILSGNTPTWFQKYVDKYGGQQAVAKIQSKPRVIGFLSEFYSSGTPNSNLSMLGLFFRNGRAMRYPRQGNRLKPVSFIMSYQFPSANSSVTSSRSFSTRGTYFRVRSGYLTP